MSDSTLENLDYIDQPDHLHEEPKSFFWKYIISFDHKIIAKQFLWFGLFWGLIGFAMSFMIRWTIAFPGETIPLLGKIFFPYSHGAAPPDIYVSLFTMHGTIMIFFAITPILIGCFGNFCIPLMIGARDMIFPWLNMLSFWLAFTSGCILMASFFVTLGPSAVGWTSYPSLALSQWSPGIGHSLWLVSLFLIGMSSIVGSINYITTIIRLRAPGMGYFDMPLTVWGLWLTAILNALFIPVLAAAFVLLFLDRVFGTQFFLAGAVASTGTQGDPIMYQHLFWIFGHPEVYIVILPAWGIVSDLLAFFSRKPAFGYKATALSMTAITILSTIVYGHHMFTTGLSPLLGRSFMVLTMLISIPSGIFFLNWLGTIWKGSIRLNTVMLFALGVVFTFGSGGLTGLHLASIGSDVYLHNTYFVVGHFHLTMASAALLGGFAAIYFWFPKMFGKMCNETLGKLHFWLTIIPINYLFFTMMLQGYMGMPRRLFNPYEYNFLQPMKPIMGYMAYFVIAMAFGQLIFFVNFFWSLIAGRKASANPWEVGTLEWTIPSPAPFYNFEKTPFVFTGPHEFSHPKLQGRDWIPQTEFLEGVSHRRPDLEEIHA